MSADTGGSSEEVREATHVLKSGTGGGWEVEVEVDDEAPAFDEGSWIGAAVTILIREMLFSLARSEVRALPTAMLSCR